MEWIKINQEEKFVFPEHEDEYLCCNAVFIQTSKKWSYRYFVANFKFLRMRNTEEKIVGEDGETGCFVDNNGRGIMVTHWQEIERLKIGEDSLHPIFKNILDSFFNTQPH